MSRDDDAQAPWWARAPARLAFLLAVLAVVAAYGVPKIIGRASAGTPTSQCPIPVKSLVRSSVGNLELKAYRDGVFALVGHGTLDTYGSQEPDAAWADTPPRNLTLPHLPEIDAGFEIRWWSRTGDHLGASLFVFPDARSAAEYVSQAASIWCRSDAISMPLSQPAGARALIWENPEGYLQTDVFLSRANVAYRLASVAPGPQGERPSSANAGQFPRVPGSLACALADASCTRPDAKENDRYA